MLTKTDIQLLREVVRGEIRDEIPLHIVPITKELKIINRRIIRVEKRLTRVEKDISWISKEFDREIVQTRHRVDALEKSIRS